MGKFQSELHILCEEAKWPEVCSILKSILESERLAGEVQQGSDDDYGDDDINAEYSAQRLRQHPPTTPPGRDGTKKLLSLSSVSPTCATTEHATIHDAASSTEDSYDGGLRCSYEKSKKIPQHHDDVTTTALLESSNYSYGEDVDVATTTPPTVGPIRRPSISSTENNVENVPTPSPSDVFSHEQIQSYKQQLISREGPNKWTPLMIACVRAPPMVLSLLTRVCPQACSIPDRSGSLPLHFVSCWRRSKMMEMDDELLVVVLQTNEGKRDILESDASESSREHSTLSRESREHLQQKKQSMEDELCLVFYILMTAYPDSVATINRWRQTPLHSLFESKPTPITMQEYSTEGDSTRNRLCSVEFLLGLWDERMCDKFNSYSFVQEPDSFSSILQLLHSAVQRALRTRDSKGRLPLHAAAGSQWVDEAMLRAVVAAYRPATWIPVIPPGHTRGSIATRSSVSWDIARNAVIPEDVVYQNKDTGTDGLFPKTGGCYGKDLAVHVLHRRLMLPLSTTENAAGSAFIDASHDSDLHSRSTSLSDASVYFNGNHCGAISVLLEPMTNAASDDFEAKLACAATGSGSNSEEADNPSCSSFGDRNCALLPLHIAAIHGVSYDIFEGLLRAHPDGACTPMVSLDSDRRRCEALPIELFEEGRSGREVNVASDTQFASLAQNYFSRSDLLFSYFPEAVSTKNMAYCKDGTRLRRFEKLIRREASGENDLFSDEAGSVWLFICRNSWTRKSRLPNYTATLGRILEGLNSESVRKLNIIRTKSSPEGVRVPTLPNGRTIIEEAKDRAPSGSMLRIMDEDFFHSAMLSYLAPDDAISYSTSCRNAQAGGVRLLQEAPDEHGTMVWELSPLFGDETDSEVHERGLRVSQPWKELSLPYVPSSTHSVLVSFEVDYQKSDRNVDEEDGGGGLLILCDDPVTNKKGMLVAASIPVRVFEAVAAQVSFTHVPGRNYTLWNYGSEDHTLVISNLSTRQLVYSVDYNGHNPLHVLLGEGDNPPNLKNQITVLTNAGFGSSKKLKATGNLPIFYALKVGASQRTLQLLIDAQPAALLDTNNEKMTPLHVALNCSRLPSVGLVEALLTHSGTNACHLKDSSGRLPLHIAAEKGASESLLQVLVEAYPDSCYRRTDVGDLPLHLLVRSGSANQSSVELLLRPIMESNTICTYGGNKELGVNLPLHIAAAYNCSFDVLQNLLTSYSEAASIRRQILKSETKGEERQKSSPEFALAILEEARGKNKSVGVMSKDRALKETDFNRRTDLIFAYFANVPKTELPYLPTYYRDEKDRMERLKTLIRKEAVNCTAMVGTEDHTSSISDMTRLTWCWMCTSNDYAGLVADVLKGLPIDVVHFLLSLENPNSEPTPNIPIKECSAPKCDVVLKSRVSFLGRYTFDPMEPPLHKTETSIVLKAKDIGAMEKYLHIQTILSDSDPDIDDYSHSCGSVYGIKRSAIEVNTFTRFCEKLGLDKSRSMEEAEALLGDFYEKDDISVMSHDNGGEINLNRIGVKKIVFDEFCKLHGIGDTGCRVVAVKFMKSRKGFELELQCREILRDGNIVPVLSEFSLESDNEDNSPPMISGYRYGIVMPCADRDLGDILYREGISSANLRCNARLIGETLKSLHEQGISYPDLQLQNVLRFGKQMMLSDFGSTLFLKSILDINAIGGSSATICPSILPPELVAKIDLSTDGYKFDQFRDYWKHVSDDADGIRLLTPHERQLISRIVASHKRGENSKGQSWRDEISSSLETIDFRDLPRVLSSCDSIHRFSSIWEQMCANHRLWDIVRPRVDMANRCAYVLKTFEDRDESRMYDISKLPYVLIRPSEKVDVWVFGIFIYQLCSGGNPFHTGFQGDLRGVDAYSRLHHWNNQEADRSVREHIQDPLAQDLLRRILVPASERLPNMSAVLRHPFFAPTSTEAERYLEKHEEMQLLRENTVVLSKVTVATSRMLEESVEKYSRIAFSTDRIAFPTCFVVLPYALQLDESLNYVATPSPEYASCAERLGKCLLEINKATARMSFWIKMNDKIRDPRNGDIFKSQMQDWIKRARVEPCNAIALEIVNSLGLGPNYALLCEEMLSVDGSISKAKSFMKNPLRAARKAIGQNADSLADMYPSLNLYLVDEDTMMPSYVDEKHSPYPLRVNFDKSLFKNALLPFINIAVMKALARGRLQGLSALLGFPASFIIPDSWKASEPGLLHSTESSGSIEEFVLLQKVVRKDDLQGLWDDASVGSSYGGSSSAGSYSGIRSFSNLSIRSSPSIDLSEGDPVITSVPMIHLELLFREFDPERHFNNLRRVSRGVEESSPGLWTGGETINDLHEVMELADIEEQLQELVLDYDKKDNTEIQLKNLIQRKKLVKMQLVDQGFPFHKEIFNSSDSIDTEYEAQIPGVNNGKTDPYAEESRANPETTGEIWQDDGTKIETHRVRNSDPDSTRDDRKKKKKMRKSKRKFRPWFGAC